MMTMSSPVTIVHQSREENLLAAKKALMVGRSRRLHRHTNMGDDVIDVIAGTNVIERHVCRFRNFSDTIPSRRPFCVEELALYQ